MNLSSRVWITPRWIRIDMIIEWVLILLYHSHILQFLTKYQLNNVNWCTSSVWKLIKVSSVIFPLFVRCHLYNLYVLRFACQNWPIWILQNFSFVNINLRRHDCFYKKNLYYLIFFWFVYLCLSKYCHQS